MRKRIAVLALAGAIACLTACGNAETGQRGGGLSGSSEKEVSGGSGKEEQEDTSDSAGTGSLTSLFRQQGVFTRFCSTDEGFYYLTERETELADGSYAPHLMYMDYASCQEVYLCSDSSCQHNTEDCTSVLKGASLEGRIFIWNGYLYFLDRDSDTGGTVITDLTGETDIEAEQAGLYRMNLDGSGRELVYQFEAGATVEDLALGGNEGIYFVTKKLGSSRGDSGTYVTTSERKLICLDPDAGNAKTVCSLDFGDGRNWEVIGCGGNRVVLEAYQYPDGMTDEEASALDSDQYMEVLKNSSIVYAALNLDTGEKKDLLTQSGRETVSALVLGGYLYTSSQSGNDIVKTDLVTGEQSILCSLPENYLYQTLGNLLCCVSYDSMEDGGYYFVNPDTGEISRCSLMNQSLDFPLDLMAVTGDRVLAVYDYEYTDLGDGSYEINRYQYGLIDLEDLRNSAADFTPVRMIGEGI